MPPTRNVWEDALRFHWISFGCHIYCPAFPQELEVLAKLEYGSRINMTLMRAARASTLFRHEIGL